MTGKGGGSGSTAHYSCVSCVDNQNSVCASLADFDLHEYKYKDNGEILRLQYLSK